MFLFTLFVDFSFSVLVDINRLVRIVQFMHSVYSVWVPEAILFYLFINFYRDNYILFAVYLLVLMNLNLDKLVKVYLVLPFLNASYQYPYYSNHKFENLTKWTLALCHILPSLCEFSIKGLQIYCRPCRPCMHVLKPSNFSLWCSLPHVEPMVIVWRWSKGHSVIDISHNRVYAKFTWLFYVYHLPRNYWLYF